MEAVGLLKRLAQIPVTAVTAKRMLAPTFVSPGLYRDIKWIHTQVLHTFPLGEDFLKTLKGRETNDGMVQVAIVQWDEHNEVMDLPRND